MQIIQSWIDSLSFFKPKVLTSFFHETTTAVVESYRTTFKYFWWLWLLLIGVYYLAWHSLSKHAFILHHVGGQAQIKTKELTAGLVELALVISLEMLLFFIICVSMHAKEERKNFFFFLKYHSWLWYWILGILIIIGFSLICIAIPLGLFFVLIQKLLPDFFPTIRVLTTVLLGPFLSGDATLVPFIIFFTHLFLGVPKPSISKVWKKLKQAFMMVMYNYPVCLVLFVIIFIISSFFSFLQEDFFLMPFISLLGLLCLPLPVCMFTVLCSNQQHKHPKRYS